MALRWLESHLRDRKRSVVIGRTSSSETISITGVPQGSVLGPLLFSLYVQPIGDIIHNHDLKYNNYADDLQLFCHFDLDTSSLLTAVRRTERCINDVKDLMTWKYLRMNDTKTEILPVIHNSASGILRRLRVRVGTDEVSAS